ncbi:UNKNOWN [Stylonychia lemnae]|uniref:Uncharacterized protein n=1 Tax=Stylonychia lemnae TaxID=5949 RepID=A0A077ZYC0_STYLE|nr:UNKNOWN [Stylonychia lemnae]|eukprot:CDW73546.1 UNKNOWN [Stylonychia lemnae]
MTGGFLTLLSYFIIAVFFALQVLDVYNRKSSINTVTLYKSYDDSVQTFNATNFDFAFQLFQFFGNDKPIDNFFRYVSLRASQIDQVLVPNSEGVLEQQVKFTDLEIVPCTKDRLFGSDYFQKILDQKNQMFCLRRNDSIYITGSTSIFSLAVDACNQNYLDQYYKGQKCEKNQTTILRTLMNMVFLTHTTSRYFDLSEFEKDPIKVNVDSEYHFFVSSLFRQTNFYLKINKATRSDSMISSLLEYHETDYVECHVGREMSNDRIDDSKPYISVAFMLTSESKIIDRQVFTIVQALANTGGIIGIVFGLFSILIGPIQEFFFFQSFIADMFLTQDNPAAEIQEKTVKDKLYNKLNIKRLPTQDMIIDLINQKNGSNSTSKVFIYAHLIDQIVKRQAFVYQTKELFAKFVRTFIFRCKQYKSKRDHEFKIAKEQVLKQFDIETILKQVKVSYSISKVLLSKYQRHLIPYFKRNLISQIADKHLVQKQVQTQENKQNQKKQEIIRVQKEEKIRNYMAQVFTGLNEQNEKDQRILKMLFVGSDEQELKLNLKQKMLNGLLRQFSVQSARQKRTRSLNESNITDLDNTSTVIRTRPIIETQITTHTQSVRMNKKIPSVFQRQGQDEEYGDEIKLAI